MDLFDYLSVIRKHKLLICGGIIAAIVISVIVSLSSPKVFTSEAVLMVEESIIPADQVSPYPNPQALESVLSTYKRLVNSQDIMQDAVRKFELNKKPYEMNWQSFRENVVSVESVHGSRLIAVEVELDDPKLAKELANFIAGQAIKKAEELSVKGSKSSKKVLDEKLEQSKKELESAKNQLKELREEAKLSIIRKELDILLDRKGFLQNQIADIQSNVEGQRKTLVQVEQSLAKEDPLIDLHRTLAEDNLYQQLLANLNGDEQQKLLSLSMVNQVQNPIYNHLQTKNVDLLSSINGMEAKLDFLREEKEANEEKLQGIQEKIVALELELEEKERVYNLKERSYEKISRKHDDIAIQIASSTPGLKLVDPALVPEKPSSPKRKLIVLGTAFISTFFFLFLAAFMEFYEMEKGRRDRVARKNEEGIKKK